MILHQFPDQVLRLYSIFSHHNDGLFVMLKCILHSLLHCFKLVSSISFLRYPRYPIKPFPLPISTKTGTKPPTKVPQPRTHTRINFQSPLFIHCESATINWTDFLRAYTINPYEERNFNYVRKKTAQTAAYLYARIQTATC